VEQLTCVSAEQTTTTANWGRAARANPNRLSTNPTFSATTVSIWTRKARFRTGQKFPWTQTPESESKESLLDKGKKFMGSDKFLPTMVAPLALTALIFAVDKIPDRYKSPGAPLSDDGNELNDDRRRAIAGGPVASGPTAGGGASTTSPVRTVLAGRRFTSLGSSDVRRKVALGA
jgi:hypothetical protein